MDEASTSHEVVTKSAEGSVEQTVAKLVDILSSKNLKLFTVIDQSKEASEVGLVLRETVLVVSATPRPARRSWRRRPSLLWTCR